MNIWLCNPFDNLVEEGARPQRYALLAAEFARRGHAVTWWTSDFSHARKARRAAADGTPLPHAYANAQGVFMRLVATPPYTRNVSLRRVRSHRAFARAIAHRPHPPCVDLAAFPAAYFTVTIIPRPGGNGNRCPLFQRFPPEAA